MYKTNKKVFGWFKQQNQPNNTTEKGSVLFFSMPRSFKASPTPSSASPLPKPANASTIGVVQALGRARASPTGALRALFSATGRDFFLGYGIHGDAKSALEFFQQMEESHVKPNEFSFLTVLSACTHAGLVEEGKHLFERMEVYSVVPTLKHYACMVDLLGRSGNLHDAEAMIHSMPIAPDGAMWGALLGACKIHNDVEIGQRVAELAIKADPENDGYYIVLSNMYSSLGKWEEAQKVRKVMKNRGIRKQAGWSAL